MIYIFIFVVSLISHAYSSSIDLITTNDLHGFIAEQDASFMNPLNLKCLADQQKTRKAV